MTVLNCRDAETAAGAIALGEATEFDRDAYRLHLSRCAHCVHTLGGEREIERTMQRLVDARDAETWQPSVSPARRRARPAGFAWGIAATAVVVAGASWLAIPHGGSSSHAAIVASASVRPVRTVQRHASAVAAAPVPRRVTVAVAPGHKLIVVHNVVQLSAPPAATRRTVAHLAAVPRPNPPRAQAPTSSDERTVADTGTTNVPQLAQHAESLALLPAVVRDVAPVGGENAIAPHPSRIAYYENAEGTTAIDVSVDERGTAVRCTVTKPSGYLVLDESVCSAAMRVRYLPRTVNGHAVSGLYHDAFTFHAGDDPQP
ncbi:MAG TPA: TonB family protein [Candidatus Tumulicola sp.]